MKKKTDKKPSAVARTVSLFTGMADVDDPEPGRARDGSQKGMPRPTGGKGKALKWTGGTRTWTAKARNKECYSVVRTASGYVVSCVSGPAPVPLGTFPSIHEAGEACDKHYEESR